MLNPSHKIILLFFNITHTTVFCHIFFAALFDGILALFIGLMYNKTIAKNVTTITERNMGMMKKLTALMLTLCLVVSGIFMNAPDSQAAIRLNKKTSTLRVGKTTQLRIRGTKENVIWRSTKKTVADVSSTGLVTAKKLGTAKIWARVSGKKYYCKITVTGSATDTKSGGKLNPLSAYDEHTISYYDDGKKIGTFKIRLKKFMSGESAADYILQNEDNPVPSNTQEYLYFQFQIKYISGSEIVDAKDLFSYYYNIFDSTGTTQLENIDWGFFFELMEDLSDVQLSPGTTSVCSKAVLVNKGFTPVIYRIRTGKNSYTWFTTDKNV